jgi:quinolinate synthase
MLSITDTPRKLADSWYSLFNRFSADLYPGRYTWNTVLELSEQALEINRLATEKKSTIVAHNYLYPEFHEIADMVSDSLSLSFFVRDAKAIRVDFESVAFMGQTAKMITGDTSRIFISDYPEVLGCSLVFGTDHAWIEDWKERTGGILVTYINSDPYTKLISDYIGTSSNTDKVIVHAAREYPGRKILVLPDRFLGYVMKARAIAQGVDPELIEIYEFFKGDHRASCYVHENIPSDSVELALAEYPDADLMIHPECGCAASCMLKVEKHEIPDTRAYFLSTEGMVIHARSSKSKRFVVATEKGMLYRLRKELPEKEFIPVSYDAECRYMKENTFEKLITSLKEDRIEVILCDDCCDPKKPYQDQNVTHISRSVARGARCAIQRMLSIV